MAPDFQLCQHVFSHSKLDATRLSSTEGLGFIPGTVPHTMTSSERSVANRRANQRPERRKHDGEGKHSAAPQPRGGPPRRKNPGTVRIHPKGDPPPGGSDTPGLG